MSAPDTHVAVLLGFPAARSIRWCRWHSTGWLKHSAHLCGTGRTLDALRAGLVIPAHPLALTQNRNLDERRQWALTCYYHASGSGGLAVGVHTTQFTIRTVGIDLLEPVLQLAVEMLDDCESRKLKRLVRIAGIHQVLYRQRLLANRLCLNPKEVLSPGQAEEIERVYRAYPHLNDDEFVQSHLDEWLS